MIGAPRRRRSRAFSLRTSPISAGIPVVLATRCPSGAAGAGYAFPGGGATWVQAGALLASTLTGPKARIALSLALGGGLRGSELASFLAGPEATA